MSLPATDVRSLITSQNFEEAIIAVEGRDTIDRERFYLTIACAIARTGNRNYALHLAGDISIAHLRDSTITSINSIIRQIASDG